MFSLLFPILLQTNKQEVVQVAFMSDVDVTSMRSMKNEVVWRVRGEKRSETWWRCSHLCKTCVKRFVLSRSAGLTFHKPLTPVCQPHRHSSHLFSWVWEHLSRCSSAHPAFCFCCHSCLPSPPPCASAAVSPDLSDWTHNCARSTSVFIGRGFKRENGWMSFQKEQRGRIRSDRCVPEVYSMWWRCWCWWRWFLMFSGVRNEKKKADERKQTLLLCYFAYLRAEWNCSAPLQHQDEHRYLTGAVCQVDTVVGVGNLSGRRAFLCFSFGPITVTDDDRTQGPRMSTELKKQSDERRRRGGSTSVGYKHDGELQDDSQALIIISWGKIIACQLID